MSSHLSSDAVDEREAPGQEDRLQEGPITILVIDDDPAVLECLREALAGLGDRIETAKNGLDGIRVFKTCHPALVVTDLLMPGATGLEVVQTIRSFDTQIPVVLMTGHADYMSTLAQQYGFTAVLRKPVGLDDLEAVLKPLLDGTVGPNTATPKGRGRAACQA